MDRSEALPRRGRLSGCLRACAWLAAWIWIIALSAPLGARAEATEFVPPEDEVTLPASPELPSCPSSEVPVLAEEEAGEVPADVRELGHLRIEQQEACRAQAQRLDQVLVRLWWVTAQSVKTGSKRLQAEANEWLEQVSQRLQSPVSVKQVGEEAGPQPVSVEGGSVEVTNPPDTEAIRTAVLDGSETSNQNAWGLAGFFTGFLLLGLFYKVVRP